MKEVSRIHPNVLNVFVLGWNRVVLLLPGTLILCSLGTFFCLLLFFIAMFVYLRFCGQVLSVANSDQMMKTSEARRRIMDR